MKTPEEIAADIVRKAGEAVFGYCPVGHGSSYYLACTACLMDRIAAAIVAERGAGATGEAALTPEDEEFVGRIRAGATMRKIWEENPEPAAQPAPAPACARCGGSGKIVVREWQTIGASGVYEWHVERTACPECGGKP